MWDEECVIAFDEYSWSGRFVGTQHGVQILVLQVCVFVWSFQADVMGYIYTEQQP